uniref:Uncharacterized protein n=1 Tax=Arundo donax TaxID=35708 RepID=A0A0A8YTZ3_ARUDO
MCLCRSVKIQYRIMLYVHLQKAIAAQ